jgi:hypothetical protein
VIIDLNEAFGEKMGEFVSWTLEREHGNLGLSKSDANKPPLSSYGAALSSLASDTSTPTPAQRLKQTIVFNAQENIALARLRLDILHENTPEVVEVEDKLSDFPADLIAFFSTGIQMIEAQQQVTANMGLVGIRILVLTLAILEYRDCTVGAVAGLLENGGYPIGNSAMSSQCLTQRIMHATRGFLVLRYGKFLCPYNETLRNFIDDGDCEPVRAVYLAMLKELDGTAGSEAKTLLLKDFGSLKEKIRAKIYKQLEVA